jgi:hypothetical protein
MNDSEKAALRILADGLCRIREVALSAPEHAYKMADVLHNVPEILADPRHGDPAYLEGVLIEAQSLLNDDSWRQN